MGRYTNEESRGGGFKPEMGIHNVVCCQVVDLGTHDTEWEGKVTGKAPMINYAFEFVDVELEHEDEKYHPMWGIREMKGLGPRHNMKKYLEGWRGKEFSKDERARFDWGAPLGKCCKLVIGPNSKGNPKLTAIVGTKEQFSGTREIREFWINEENPDHTFPEWMPEWMQKIISSSYEYSGIDGVQEDESPIDNVSTEFDDDIPF